MTTNVLIITNIPSINLGLDNQQMLDIFMIMTKINQSTSLHPFLILAYLSAWANQCESGNTTSWNTEHKDSSQ